MYRRSTSRIDPFAGDGLEVGGSPRSQVRLWPKKSGAWTSQSPEQITGLDYDASGDWPRRRPRTCVYSMCAMAKLRSDGGFWRIS